MTLKPSSWIWHHGKLIPWPDAQVHVLSHALHYGSSVFEGIRTYATADGPVFFRLADHLRRLFASARIHHMAVPFTYAEIETACHAVIRGNHLQSAYIRPLVYVGYGSLGVVPADGLVCASVAAFEWGAYLGEETREQGAKASVSSWRRPAPDTLPTMAKAGGNYLSSTLMSREAKRLGFDEAIALDCHGFLSEGPGENLFLVRDGVVYTPAAHHAILPGITRDSVIQLLEAQGFKVREQTLPREWLYLADELFFTGTAAEVVPICAIDGLTVGKGVRGPVTTEIQKAFFDLVNGFTPDPFGWLEPVAEVKALAEVGS